MSINDIEHQNFYEDKELVNLVLDIVKKGQFNLIQKDAIIILVENAWLKGQAKILKAMHHNRVA